MGSEMCIRDRTTFAPLSDNFQAQAPPEAPDPTITISTNGRFLGKIIIPNLNFILEYSYILRFNFTK